VSSYQVFARKYRPQTFDSVVGQEHITQTLKNAIATNRLAHAYLFVGPRGTGKTSTARILAKALNCIHGPTVNPCGECDPCREIAAGNSLDVLEIDGASNNGVEQVRELRENVRFAPTRGKYKLYIIDEVHMLTTAAFNALLKTLEEPPEHVKFIFATTDVQKVLPTILSRCQRFDLRRIPAESIARHLEYIAHEEKIQLDHDAARTIAKGAEGGLRDAESMLDQLVAFCGERITEQDVLSVFGFTASQTVASLCDHLLDGDSSAALGAVQQQAEAGRDLSRLMADLIGHLRNLLVAKADPDGIRAEVGDETLAELQAQSDRIAMDRLLDLIEQFAAAEGRMKWAPNKKLHFEIAVIKAIQTLGQTSLTEVLEALTALRTGGELPTLKEIKAGKTARPEGTSAPRKVEAPAPKPAPAPKAAPAPVHEGGMDEHGLTQTKPAPEPVHEIHTAHEVQPPTPENGPDGPRTPEPLPTPTPAKPPVAELAPWDDRPAVTAAVVAEPPVAVSAPVLARESLELAPWDELPLAAEPQRAEEPLLFAADPVPPSLEPVVVAAPEPEPPKVWRHPQELPPEPPVAPPIPEPVPAFEEPSLIQEEPAPEPEPEVESLDSAPDLAALWLKIFQALDFKPMLQNYLRKGALVEVNDAFCTIGFPEDQGMSVQRLRKPDARKLLEDAVLGVTGKPLRVEVEVRSDVEIVPLVIPEKAPEPVVDPMELFKNDPLIRQALEIFAAQIQPN